MPRSFLVPPRCWPSTSRNQYPEARFNSLAVFKNIKAEAHKDAHNVGLNVAILLTDYKGADIVVHEPEGPRVLKLSDGPSGV